MKLHSPTTGSSSPSKPSGTLANMVAFGVRFQQLFRSFYFEQTLEKSSLLIGCSHKDGIFCADALLQIRIQVNPGQELINYADFSPWHVEIPKVLQFHTTTFCALYNYNFFNLIVTYHLEMGRQQVLTPLHHFLIPLAVKYLCPMVTCLLLFLT